jgi:hypothetical protein
MLLSHRHKFIFLHCRKSAGSSIVVSLARYLGPNDLQISGIVDAVEEGIRPPERVVREAFPSMNLWVRIAMRSGSRRFWSAVSRNLKKKYFPLLGDRAANAPAVLVRQAFPKEWEHYFKFCVVRNPWDKTLSDYFWRTRGLQNPPSFESYVLGLESGDSLNGIIPRNHDNWPLFTINDHIVVDKVIRYENLKPDLDSAIKTVGIKWDGWLPRKKGGFRPKNRQNLHYRAAYQDRTAEIVARLYRKEIAAFGYSF